VQQTRVFSSTATTQIASQGWKLHGDT
jgi:hypothetical protein